MRRMLGFVSYQTMFRELYLHFNPDVQGLNLNKFHMMQHCKEYNESVILRIFSLMMMQPRLYSDCAKAI